MDSRRLILVLVLLFVAVISVPVVSAQNDPCPVTAPSGTTALLAAADACLNPAGPFYQRDAARALVYAQEAAAAQPDPAGLARAYDLQAWAHFWLGEPGQAIARQTQALITLPAADRYLMRAAYMNQVGDVSGAIADAEQAILLAPRQIDSYLWLGRYALEQGEFDVAWDVANRAAAVAPDDADVVLLQGDTDYARADYASAKAAYERYLSLTPDVSPVVTARLMIIERRLGG